MHKPGAAKGAIKSLCASLLAATLFACASVPPGSHYPKHASAAFQHPEETRLGKQLLAGVQGHPGDSAFRMISVGIDGFAARIELIDAAEKTLDVQYFIFRQDESGKLIAAALLRAADRGVHVRLLVDDGDTVKGDGQLRLLAAHPQIEMRVFDPFVYRGNSTLIRAAEFLARHQMLDFRMHNKLLVADNAGALIGGRNIGDQYFQIDSAGQFADDDMFVGGPTVVLLSAKFDDFWNSALAIPVEALAGGRPSSAQLDEYRQRLNQHRQEARAEGADFMRRAQGGDPLDGILDGRLPLEWATAQVVCDSPEKKRVRNGDMAGHLMYAPVARSAAEVKTELLMITPYFVPTADELKLLTRLRERNVRIRILTNSLNSATELAAQSGYAGVRPALLAIGVEIYELRALLGNTRGSGQKSAMSRHGTYGLHAKLYIFDRRELFVGSMNFDHRSARLNTEVGLIIANAVLAQQAATRFERMTAPANAYRVLLQDKGAGKSQMVWRTEENHRVVDFTEEPSRSSWRRFAQRVLTVAPIEDEL